MTMKLSNKTVVVTGASSGIGLATARLLAARGARVAMLARSEQQLAAAVRDIAAAGGHASAFAVDLSDATQVESTCKRLLVDMGPPDVLINNAGAGRWKPLIDTSLDEARKMIEVPYLAAFYVTRLLLPSMIQRGSGRIACITSPASHMVWSRACGYIAARHAIKGFAEALRADLRGVGVGVTLVTLGPVKSSYWENNPGSREHVPLLIPWLMPELSSDDAARAIVAAIESERPRVVRPRFYRALFAFGAKG
jgi:uncharacterized protein